MIAHTPAPWEVREIHGPGFPGQVGYAIDFNEDQEQVVDFVYTKEDAYLIAAAPEMYEAIEYIRANLCWMLRDSPRMIEAVSEYLDVALNKARGM